MERSLIFSTFLEGDRHSLNKKETKAERRMENIKERSTQDINALGAQHIKGAFFFSLRLFEWNIK